MQSKKKIKNKGRLEAESQITPSELESLSEHEETEDEGGEASNENPSNAEMMKAFKAMERQVSGKVDEILSAVVDVKVRLTEAEERISGTEDEIVQLKARNDTLEKQVKSMADKVSGSSAPQSVERLHEMLQNEDMAQCLQVQLSIMADKCERILQLLDIFQSRKPITTKVFDYFEDLQMNFTANKELQYESCAEHFEGLDVHHVTKTHILNLVHLAYSNAEEKLTKYMSEGQPAINFLREVRVFDPRYISFSVSGYTHIPGFSAVPNDEFDAYFQCLGPAALKASACGVVDLDVFCDGLLERLPVLSALAKRYKDVIVNSAYAERSNSLYKLVLSSRRRSITNSNLKVLVFLYHNQRLTSGVFERDELKIDCGPDSEDEVEDSLDT
ncbi:CGG triplet repeat-binding 1 [Labeo rohita]|uniref:CGG triplet repeat-binding 1 n=1 Tax=Labeo rohita TaxID=84645 RepID=A0A498L5J1_LABRO|nr:CGG triplet repeat-binding 1 [Labeo rohita]